MFLIRHSSKACAFRSAVNEVLSGDNVQLGLGLSHNVTLPGTASPVLDQLPVCLRRAPRGGSRLHRVMRIDQWGITHIMGA
jgi:hypothetical protein